MKTLTTMLLVTTLAGGATALGGLVQSAQGSGAQDSGDLDSGDQSSGDKAPTPLGELLPSVRKPALWIGSDAPEMTIASYLKGESIASLDDDHTYVVEFWATWCGPCIAAFPHLTELQERYSGDVTFVGVNIWEQESGAERAAKVGEFVEDQGDRMGYTVALEEGSSMSEGWMRPAGQNGIPAAFVVDGGKVAWIGHPMQLDEPLEEIVSGSYDIGAAAKDAWDMQLLQMAFRRLVAQSQAGSWDECYELGRSMTATGSDDPMLLNAVAYYLMAPEGAPERNIALGLAQAREACERSGWGNWMILDTFAKGLDLTGDTARAAEIQRQAIELAKEDGDVNEEVMADLRASLAAYGG